MVFRRFSEWSLRLYNRHFERPLFTSVPFVCVTVLFAVTLGREAWILVARWPALPPGGPVLFFAVVAMTPLMWLKGIAQHRQHRGVADRLSEPVAGGLSLGGAMAADYVYTSSMGYLLLSIVLSFVPR